VEKRKTVMEDLDKVEPAVQEAQQGNFFIYSLFCLSSISIVSTSIAVKSIKKQNLVEIKNLNNPPQGVKITLESICLLLGEETTDWKSIRSIMMRDNFISTIVNFNTDDLS
jgi:dynein heavy chain 1